MTNVQQIKLSSQDRSSVSTSSADCVIVPGAKWMPEGDDIYLLYFSSYNAMYQIITGVNDKIDFNENSTNLTATLSPGVYDSSSLATQIGTAMTNESKNNDASYNTYTVSYSSTTRLYTFSASNSFTLKFASGTNTNKAPWRECGFSNSSGTSPVDSTPGTSATSPNQAFLGLPLSLIININELDPAGVTSSNPPKFYSYVIPLTASSGAQNVWEAKQSFKQVARRSGNAKTGFNQFTVQLYYQTTNSGTYQIVPLQNTEWEMILLAK